MIFPLQLFGSHLVGHFTSGWFCRVCLGTGEFLWLQGTISPGFYPLQWGWVYCLPPESPIIRRMPVGPQVFLALPEACGLRPCDWTHLKNGLVPHLYVGGTYDE